jgi:hypothetical protein
MDNLWDIVFSQQPRQEGLRGFGIPMPLEENVEYETVPVHGPLKPVSDAVHARTHLVEMPPGTLSGFPVAQVFSEKGSELDTPLAESFMADHDAALVQQFLHVSVAAKRPHGRCSGQEAQRKAVVKLNSLLDDEHRETVAVRLCIGHGRSAYPDPIKATQPSSPASLRRAIFASNCRSGQLHALLWYYYRCLRQPLYFQDQGAVVETALVVFKHALKHLTHAVGEGHLEALSRGDVQDRV